ncbi:Leucine rich repeat C-terminal domain [Branchiostoma belcheri]|nr:Leucine rich repeat C-terminal domain [Branchiostoma belcheri]
MQQRVGDTKRRRDWCGAAKDDADGSQGYEMEMGTTLRSGKSARETFLPSILHYKFPSARGDREIAADSLYLHNISIKDRECTMMGKAPPGVLMFLLVVLKMMGTAEAACSCSSSVCDFSSQNFTCVPHVLGLPTDIKICDCSNENLTSVPQHLPTDITQFNQLTSLPISSYDILKSIYDINIDNNPWQCCRMVDMRFKMTGSYPFENQITCSQPDIIHGIPTPDITVTLPSGLNADIESHGRVTVDVNGTVFARDVTAASDAGLYVCVAENPIDSNVATLVVQTLATIVITSQATSATFFLKTWGRSGVDARHSHGCKKCKSVVCTPRLAVSGCVHRTLRKWRPYSHVLLPHGTYGARASLVLARTGRESADRTHEKFNVHLKFYGVSACSQIRRIPYGGSTHHAWMPCVCPRRQHAEARTAGCDRSFKAISY